MDAGHGGKDDGAMSASGIKEKDINTEVYLGLWDDIGTPERLNAARKTISL